MSSVTVRSEDVRLKWQETLDVVSSNQQDVVIERHNRPVVTLVNYAKWQATIKRLQELELLNEVRQIKARLASGETKTITHDELKRLILAKRAEESSVNVGD
ncbi:MAG: type II toxin-antitoxin system Phd/YefM family antitoxin [Caldilineaceae bacterium]